MERVGTALQKVALGLVKHWSLFEMEVIVFSGVDVPTDVLLG